MAPDFASDDVAAVTGNASRTHTPQLTLIREGSTSLFVPSESLSSKSPRTYPAFFNPAARINRDISVAVARAVDPPTYLDTLAGVGARGVRIATEGPPRTAVTMVEFNPISLEIAKRSARENQLSTKKCVAVQQEANVYLHSRFSRPEKFHYVDLDPFGTPAPFVQGALVASADGAVLSVTATDTAVLCGAYPSSALRRYGVHLTRSEFMHEAAVRVLVGFCVRMGGVYDIGIEPIAAHSTLHYLRAYMRVRRGAAASDRSVRNLGYVGACDDCHENSVMERYSSTCPRCGGGISRPIGPLWVGKMLDEKRIVEPSVEFCRKEGWDDSAAVLGALIGMDTCPPHSYSIECIASREKFSSVRFELVLESLRARGFKAMRQPFGAMVVKTDASYSDVRDAVREGSNEYPKQTR